MKKIHVIIAAIVSIIFLSSNTIHAGDEAEGFKAAVQEIFKTYSAANVAGDTASYMALCDENIVKMGPNRPATFGKPALEESKRKGHQKWNPLIQKAPVRKIPRWDRDPTGCLGIGV